jgi:hypothetical protein
MFRIIVIFIVLFSLTSQAARRKSVDDSEGDVSLALTHILPSTAVIPAGTFAIGTSAGMGFFDLFDITTNLVYDFQSVFNVMGKVAVYHDHDFAFAPYVSFLTESVVVTTDNLGDQGSLTSTAWEPGATFSYRIAPQFTGHTGFLLVFRNPPIYQWQVQNPRTALVQGNTVNQEFTTGITSGFAFSTGASYDLTYQIWGAGASFHISGFHIGAHFYFNVGEGNFMPILGGGWSGSF